MAGKPYRSHQPYRKHAPYRGSSVTPAPNVGSASYAATWRRAPARAVEGAAGWSTVPAYSDGVAMPFGAVALRVEEALLAWASRSRSGSFKGLDWGGAERDDADLASAWRTVRRHRADDALLWGPSAPHRRAAALPWRTPPNHREASALPWHHVRGRKSVTLAEVWRALAGMHASVALPWGPAGRRNSDVGFYWPREPPAGTDPITVPFQPVYFMIPTLEAWLLSGDVPLPLLSATISGDIDSWAWTFSAPIPYAALDLVNPANGAAPAEIAIAVNGHVWTFIVEGYEDNRRFGSRTATIRGRSRSAELAAPFSGTRTYTQAAARSFAQLASEELAGTGWSVLWDTVNTVLPSGTFSYQDLSPMDALARLAGSVGAAVQTHMADKAITIRPAYGESPWAWDSATPYAILPASIMTQGSGSWQGGTNAAGVYVYGERATYGALVKLAGTAGAPTLPMVTDSLLISADPVRERGRIELARAGIIKQETRTYPLFADPAPPGLIPIGALVDVEDQGEPQAWRGQVTGVRIEANRSDRALVVRQHLSIERQFR